MKCFSTVHIRKRFNILHEVFICTLQNQRPINSILRYAANNLVVAVILLTAIEHHGISTRES